MIKSEANKYYKRLHSLCEVIYEHKNNDEK